MWVDSQIASSKVHCEVADRKKIKLDLEIVNLKQEKVKLDLEILKLKRDLGVVDEA